MNKKFYRDFFYSFLMFVCCFAFPSYSFADSKTDKNDTAFAQLSSFQTQIPGISSQTVVLENTDQLVGLKVAASHKKIVVTEPGVYFISANGRLGTQSVNLLGSVQLFIIKNGTPLANTYSSYSPQSKQAAISAVSQTVEVLDVGDSISVGISSTSPNLGLISSSVVPSTDIPSITFTMYKFAN